MTKLIQKHTFGVDRGIEVLVEILNSCPKEERKRATAFFQRYITELEQLKYVKDYGVKIAWLERIYKYYKKLLEEDRLFTLKVKDFGHNLLITHFRTKLRTWQQKGYTGPDGKWHNKRRNVSGQN